MPAALGVMYVGSGNPSEDGKRRIWTRSNGDTDDKAIS